MELDKIRHDGISAIIGHSYAVIVKNPEYGSIRVYKGKLISKKEHLIEILDKKTKDYVLISINEIRSMFPWKGGLND